jgi:hypothetical protein
LFKDGEYLTDAEPYRQFGEYWEALGYWNRWGGNWDKDGEPFEPGEDDANHFSYFDNGKM